VLALAIAAGVGGRVFVCGVAVGGMFFCTMSAVSPMFAHVGSVSVTIASTVSSHGAVIICNGVTKDSRDRLAKASLVQYLLLPLFFYSCCEKYVVVKINTTPERFQTPSNVCHPPSALSPFFNVPIYYFIVSHLLHLNVSRLSFFVLFFLEQLLSVPPHSSLIPIY
jgi:hypothetical protein